MGHDIVIYYIRKLDRQADRMIDRGMEVVETDVEVGPYGPAQHFESDIILLLSTKILAQELTSRRDT